MQDIKHATPKDCTNLFPHTSLAMPQERLARISIARVGLLHTEVGNIQCMHTKRTQRLLHACSVLGLQMWVDYYQKFSMAFWSLFTSLIRYMFHIWCSIFVFMFLCAITSMCFLHTNCHYRSFFCSVSKIIFVITTSIKLNICDSFSILFCISLTYNTFTATPEMQGFPVTPRGCCGAGR